jgi:hypothetical protein
MAALVALLIIVPVTARPGTDTAPGDGVESLTVEVTRTGATDIQPTRLGTTTYVSNRPQDPSAADVTAAQAEDPPRNIVAGEDENPANTVQVRMTLAAGVVIPSDDGTTDDVDEQEAFLDSYVRVSSPSGETLRVDVEESGRTLTGSFMVVAPTGANPPAGTIEALDGDTITVRAGSVQIKLVVDGVGPSFSSISPDDGTLQDSSSTTVGFIVADNGSGLRTDREDGADGDADGDGQPAEPLSYGASGDQSQGASVDIDLVWDGTAGQERRGDRNWVEVTKDKSYSVSYGLAGLSSKEYEWYIEATDRVGNKGRTDASSSKSGAQDFSLDVDNDAPKATGVYAGIGFDDGEEVYDSSSILVIFHNEGEHGLDPDTIETGAFRVVGNDVVDVIYPGNALSLDDDDEECESDTGLVNPGTDDCINTLNRMYLVLGSPLDDDETPEVQISSSQFTDRADNGNESVEEEAADWILPTLTITVTGDANADGRPLAQEEITVRVESGELLLRRPSIWLVTVDAEGNINDAGLSRTLGTITGESMAWESDFEADQFAGLSGDSGFGAIIIQAEDRSPQRNEVSSAGWKGKGTIPNDEDELVLAKMDAAGLLVEFDADVPVAEVEVTPNRGDDRETESGNPFIKLTFGEGTEYTSETIPEVDAVEDDDSTQADESKDAIPAIPGDKSVTQGDDKTTIDSYDEVTITSITLNGDDVSNGLARIDDAEFNLSLRGLDVGDYTIEYTASDTAGNEITEEEEFAVLDRSDYEIELRPGWNLVSLPASPGDPAVGSVLGADHGASTVLSYQSGEWVSATRDAETGGWVGTLTDMVAGYGYFVQTDSFDPLATLIPEADPTTALPTVPVSSGWNLLGVVDVGQRDAGATIDADLYFASIEWSVAYGFDTTTNRWEKLTEDASDNPDTADEDENAYVENGAGYWVWATKAGTLVP